MNLQPRDPSSIESRRLDVEEGYWRVAFGKNRELITKKKRKEKKPTYSSMKTVRVSFTIPNVVRKASGGQQMINIRENSIAMSTSRELTSLCLKIDVSLPSKRSKIQ